MTDRHNVHGSRHDDVLHVTVISPWPGSPGNRKLAREEAAKMAEQGEFIELLHEAGNDYTFRASDSLFRLVIGLDVVPDNVAGEMDALVCECETLEEARALYRQTQAVMSFMATKGKLVDPGGKYLMHIEARVGNGEWVHAEN